MNNHVMAVPRVRTRTAVVLLVLSILSLFGSILTAPSAHAEGHGDSRAKQVLSQQVYAKVSSKTYTQDGGGVVKGSQLMKKNAAGVYSVNDDMFRTLDSDARSEFADDVVKSSQEVVQKNKSKGITNETQSNWLQDLGKHKGFGSRIITQTLDQTTGVDIAGGGRLYSPFAPYVSTLLGALSIALMAFLALIILLDTAYITIPPVRMFLAGSDSGVAKKAATFVTGAARKAVQKAEEGNDEGGFHHPLWPYIRYQALGILFFGAILVLFINGRLWSTVGVFLDLFLGFLPG